MFLNTLAVYIHWPFCKSKCPYCDFNSHVRDSIDHNAWKEAYLHEMRYTRDLTGPRTIESVFFGGGTPSLMEPGITAAIIDEIDTLWGLPQHTEITLEANPTSVEAEKLKNFKSAGVNRVSLGVQAMNDPDLKALGREHSAEEAMAAVKMAADIFDRFTFDLIYARPHQSVTAWEAELKDALQYGADHMSLYQLTIEEGTAFHTLHQRGDLIIPDEDTAAALYETTQDIMGAHDMPAYEISNHAKQGQESRHNMVYWQYRDYAGIGPGAHGRLTINNTKQATRTHRAPEAWLQRVTENSNGYHPFEEITPSQRGTEMIMMGLRLTGGIDLKRLEAETGQDTSKILLPERVATLESEGFMTRTKTHIMATMAGRQRLNALLPYLLDTDTAA
ncbi:MAG: radical SAM family heme chaperone HemW [Alphaproteobacteria bacterium]|nr:radical SAM family heme chaperone HemW [Alphaproteobacteria bacterium]